MRNSIDLNTIIAKLNSDSNTLILTELDLRHQEITDEDILKLCEALANNTKVTKLQLGFNKIGLVGAQALAKLLVRNHHIKELYLKENNIGDNGVKALCKALSESTGLTHLGIASNLLTDDSLYSLAEVFNHKTTGLIFLDLSHNNFSARGLAPFGKSLRAHDSLTELYLGSSFHLGTQACESLCQSLQGNATLTTLHLDNNQIRDEGLPSLCNLLVNHPGLVHLNLAGNTLTNHGLEMLIQLVKKQGCLLTLDVVGNLLEKTFFANKTEELENSLKENRNRLIAASHAVRSNNIRKLETCIEKGISLLVSAKDSNKNIFEEDNGNSLLHLALQTEHFDIAHFLVKSMQNQRLSFLKINRQHQTVLQLAQQLAQKDKLKPERWLALFSTFYQAGQAALQNNDFQLAIHYFNQSIGFSPTAEAFYARALAKYKLAFLSGASIDVQQALQLDSNNNKIQALAQEIAEGLEPTDINSQRVDKGRTKIGPYELVNWMNNKEANKLEEQTGIKLEFPIEEDEIKPYLGRGAFGKLRIAYDTREGCYIGVKKIKGDNAIAASKTEATLQRKLSYCPHVMPLTASIESVDSQGKPALYHFMPLAGLGNGEHFKHQLQFISDPGVRQAFFIHVAKSLLIGLQQMHQKGIYHLDIKPDNFVIDGTGYVYIIDFGCAKELSPQKPNIYDGGAGDTRYFAPERLAHFRYLWKKKGAFVIAPATEQAEYYDAAKADIWALGLTLLELWFGKRPFDNIPFLSKNAQGEVDCSPKLNQWDKSFFENALSFLYQKEFENDPVCAFLRTLLHTDPEKRCSAVDAIKFPLFQKKIVFADTSQAFRTLRILNNVTLSEDNKKAFALTRHSLAISAPLLPSMLQREQKDFSSNNNNNALQLQSSNAVSSTSNQFDLTQKITEVLLQQGVIQKATDIQNIAFSKSYNLRFYCLNKTVMQQVQMALSSFGAVNLNEWRQIALNKVDKTTTQKNQEFTVSVRYDEVVNFLKNYGQLSLKAIASLYAAQLKGQGKYKEVEIQAEFIRINGYTWTLEDCIREHKFGKPYHSHGLPFISNLIHPELSQVAIAQIMEELAIEQGIKQRINARYFYKPVVKLPLKQQGSERNFNIVADVLTSAKSKISPALKQKLHELILQHYNAITAQACLIYSHFTLSDFLNPISKARQELAEFEAQLAQFIKHDILSESNVATRLFKYWMYIQIAVLSCIKGNTCITSIILTQVLNDEKIKGFSQYFPQSLGQTVAGLSKELDALERNEQIEKNKQYFTLFGGSLPSLKPYYAWFNIASTLAEAEKIKLIRQMESYISPILSFHEAHIQMLVQADFTLSSWINKNKDAKACSFMPDDISFKATWANFTTSLEHCSFAADIRMTLEQLAQRTEKKLDLDKDAVALLLKLVKLPNEAVSMEKGLLVWLLEDIAKQSKPREEDLYLVKAVLQYNIARVNQNIFRHVHKILSNINLDPNLAGELKLLLQAYTLTAESSFTEPHWSCLQTSDNEDLFKENRSDSNASSSSSGSITPNQEKLELPEDFAKSPVPDNQFLHKRAQSMLISSSHKRPAVGLSFFSPPTQPFSFNGRHDVWQNRSVSTILASSSGNITPNQEKLELPEDFDKSPVLDSQLLQTKGMPLEQDWERWVNEAVKQVYKFASGESFYHGMLAKAEIDDKLKEATVGSFVLRKSSSHPNALAISYVGPNREIKHVLLSFKENYFVSDQFQFDSITKYLEAYRNILISPISLGIDFSQNLSLRTEQPALNNNNNIKPSIL